MTQGLVCFSHNVIRIKYTQKINEMKALTAAGIDSDSGQCADAYLEDSVFLGVVGHESWFHREKCKRET